jgi:nicotinamide phosphoribosyltransferase
MKLDLTVLTDSYKASHAKQYPPGTRKVYSFLEARVGATWDETVFFGLQYYLSQYFALSPFWLDVPRAEQLYRAHLGPGIFNLSGFQHLGRMKTLPLRIKAVPEGTPVPVGNVMMTVENTDPEFFWLTNYVESLLVQVWYPSTVATQSRVMKRHILAALEESGDPTLIDFKLHDFGFRGSTSPESAAIGGCAHLVNFKGTDTVPALILAQEFYDEPMAGFSIPAAEHSTITSWGREREVEAYANMLDQFPGMVAIVSDSYDIFAACRDLWGGVLKDRVLAHEGTVVIRPDSGDPLSVLRRVMAILGDKFGAEVNHKGYKVLNPKVRVIQGDGIDLAMMDTILQGLALSGWSADNLAFGSGGGLLQKVNRDTQRFAFKCSYVEGETETNGWSRAVMKDPITDPGKTSKAGKLALIRTDRGLETIAFAEDAVEGDLLQLVYENGVFYNQTTLADVRARASVV